MHHILGAVAGLVLLFIVVKGFFGSFWRAPPKREDSTATDWGAYGGWNADRSDHHGEG
jgi:hypothetical protein